MSEPAKRNGTGGEGPLPSIEDLLTSSNWEDRLAEARARRERVLSGEGTRGEAPVVRLPRAEDGAPSDAAEPTAEDPAPRTAGGGLPGFGPGRTGLGPPSRGAAVDDEAAPPNLLRLHGPRGPASGVAAGAGPEVVARPAPRPGPAEVPAPPPARRAGPMPLAPRWRADPAVAAPPSPRWRGPLLGAGLGLCLGLAIGLSFAVGAWYAGPERTVQAPPLAEGAPAQPAASVAAPTGAEAPFSSAQAPMGPAAPPVVGDLPEPPPSARPVPAVGADLPSAASADPAPVRPEPTPAVTAKVEPPRAPASAATSEGPAIAPPALPGGAGRAIAATPAEAPMPERDVPLAAADPLPPPEPSPAVPAEEIRRSIYLHAPTALPDGAVAEIAAVLGGSGFSVNAPIRVGFDVGSDHVRYYHAGDADAARAVARTLDATARDFTGYRPAPAPGTIEVWLATSR